MTSFDELLHENMSPEVPSDPNAPTARSWQPGLEMDRNGIITVTTRTVPVIKGETDAHLGTPEEFLWKQLIDDWSVDPEKMEIIDGSISLIQWMSPIKGATEAHQVIPLQRYKVQLRRRREFDPAYADVTELIEEIKKSGSKKKLKEIDPELAKNAERAMVVTMADWQIGKGEGDGTAGTVKRVLKGLDQLVQHIKDLKKLGRAPDVILLVGMGDLVERCSGNYPSQAFISDLDEREQSRVARRLVIEYVNRISDLGIYVMLSGVGGNHGENRNGEGKAYTRPSDNLDVALIDQVGDVISNNPERYEGRVEVFVPDGGLELLVKLAGVNLGFIHGHQNSSPGNSVCGTLENWWTKQVMGGVRNLMSAAQILVSGHYHHFLQSEATGRVMFQCPSQDPGSQWYKDKTGKHSPPGMLTFMVSSTAYGERLWGDLFICTSQIDPEPED
jgi:predicted phosphodiesterase